MRIINTWPGWECVRQLGAGAFGKVYEIQREENGKVYNAALKIVSIPQNEAFPMDAKLCFSGYNQSVSETTSAWIYLNII